MLGYLLDTNIISFWFDETRREHPAVQAAAEACRGDSPLYVSAISLGEIEYGHAVHPAGAGPRREAFVRFVSEELPQVLPVARHTAEPRGRIRSALFERFGPKSKKTKDVRVHELCDPTTGHELGIDENDLWIMAQAAERNLVLVTHDKMVRIREVLRDLEHSVQIQDWAADRDGVE